MKKVYIKPEITFESFILTSNIATTCGDYKANSSDENTCEYVETENGDTIIVFNTDGNGDCRISCYHVPTAGITVFGS